MAADLTADRQQRFGRLIERDDGRDFPFYDGRPITVPAWRWVLVIAASAAGFVALTTIPVSGQAGLLLTRLLFVAIPLAVFVAVTGRCWRSIIRPLRGRDLANMIVFWLLNLGVSAAAAFLVAGGDVNHLTANTAVDDLAAQGGGAIALFYLGTFFQLFGEELFTVLPFLAVLAFTYQAGASRKTGVIVAWVVTAIWFGAAHLQTYDWNVGQAILVIGAARIVLTLAFVRTKNILVSFGAHLLNDWGSFTFALVVAAARVT